MRVLSPASLENGELAWHMKQSAKSLVSKGVVLSARSSYFCSRIPRFGDVCGGRSAPLAGVGVSLAGLAWQFEQRIVSVVRNFHTFPPARLAAIAAVWLVPIASIGWKEGLRGSNSTPLSRRCFDGVNPALPGSAVNPEWHLKQSWYS